MNKMTQLWALLKFQLRVYPLQFLIVFPLVLGMTPLIFTVVLHDPPGLHILLMNQNLFFVVILGYTLLAPEISRTSATSAQWATGTEFVLTRAVDRGLVMRARAIIFLLAILAVPLVMLPSALLHPVLRVREFVDADQRQIMEHIPGSTFAPAVTAGGIQLRSIRDILIPHGSIDIASWRIWSLVSLAIGTELTVLLFYPLKHRMYYLWATFAAIAGGLIYVNYHITLAKGTDSGEQLFFTFAAHQPIIWAVTLALAYACQIWSEWRFATSEH
jgi:hypothetical protein